MTKYVMSYKSCISLLNLKNYTIKLTKNDKFISIQFFKLVFPSITW